MTVRERLVLRGVAPERLPDLRLHRGVPQREVQRPRVAHVAAQQQRVGAAHL